LICFQKPADPLAPERFGRFENLFFGGVPEVTWDLAVMQNTRWEVAKC
jgi:hypothetical protein